MTLEDPRRQAGPVVLCSWTAGDDGIAGGNLGLPDWPDGTYTLLCVVEDDEAGRASVPITLKRAHKVYLATDKPIYQPGQTVHMRCLVLRKPKLEPAAGRQVAFTVHDPQGNLVFSDKRTLSDFGIAAADMPTDPLISPGPYKIKVAADADAGEQTVEIFHYKLPAFALKLALDEPWYLPGQEITGTVEARYHFGRAVAGARVELELRDRSLPEANIAGTTTLTTDAAGKARFAMPVPHGLVALRRTGGDAHLLLAARATDAAWQVNAAYRTVVVARQAIRIAAVVENGAAAANLPARLFVVTSYPDGRPAPTTVSVETLAQSLRTDPTGAAVFAARRLPSAVQITARDARGRTGTVRLDLPTVRGDAFVFRADKPIYTVGDTIALEFVATGATEIFVDVVKDRQTYLTKSVRTGADGLAKLALDLPAELAGTLRLHACRLDRQGEWGGRDTLIVVKPATQLRVAVAKDRDTYRPGMDAHVTFTVTDPAGRPAPAALSLAGVDEAVYSVQQAHPGLAATLLGLDEELLRPAIEAHDLTFSLMPESDLYSCAVLSAAVAPPRRPGGQAPPKVHSLEYDGGEAAWEAFYSRKYAAEDFAVTATALASVATGAGLIVLLGYILRPAIAAFAKRAARPGAIIGLTILLLILGAAAFWPSLCRYVGQFYAAVRSGDDGTDPSCLSGPGDPSPWVAPRPRPQWPMPRPEPDDSRAEEGAAEPARVRTYFPETMLWRPEVVTDEGGVARLTVPLADSITTWRLNGQAVSRAGALGTVDSSVRVFQPFFVDVDAPLALTQGDEVSVPLVVYNYTPDALDVTLACEASSGLTLLETAPKALSLRASQVRRVHVRVRAEAIGTHTLTVRARAGAVADAVERPVRVMPPGLPQSLSVNGEIAAGDEFVELTIPPDAVDGSIAVWIKLYPSRFSELLDGLENILRMPHGCFEQTSSTTYPNVMALEYLDAHDLGGPDVRAKARRYINLGYQRLIRFEVPGGGFDWFGRAPASVVLTAFGLMQFTDMAKVHTVDPALLRRTAALLAIRQGGDGAWEFESGCFHEPFTGGDDGDVGVTAYVTWALGRHDASAAAARRGAAFVARRVGGVRNAYTLALCTNALLACDRTRSAGLAAAKRLAAMAAGDGPKKRCWGDGPGGDVSATSLAALALMQAQGDPVLVADALRWIAAQRDPYGTWGATRSTVLALQALIAGSRHPQKRTADAQLAVVALVPAGGADQPLGEVIVPAENSDAVRIARLAGPAAPGRYRLCLRSRKAEGMAYQVAVRYHSEAAAEATTSGPGQRGLALKVDYDRTSLATDATVKVRAIVMNNTLAKADMLVVDIGTPPGFAVRAGGLEFLRTVGTIERYSLTARGVIVYLRSLAAREQVTIEYAMAANMPLKAVAPPARVYAYYQPDNAAAAKAVAFTVEPGALHPAVE